MEISDLQINEIYTLDNLILKCIKIRTKIAHFVELNSDLSAKYRPESGLYTQAKLDTCILCNRINELKIYSSGRAL